MEDWARDTGELWNPDTEQAPDVEAVTPFPPVRRSSVPSCCVPSRLMTWFPYTDDGALSWDICKWKCMLCCKEFTDQCRASTLPFCRPNCRTHGRRSMHVNTGNGERTWVCVHVIEGIYGSVDVLDCPPLRINYVPHAWLRPTVVIDDEDARGSEVR